VNSWIWLARDLSTLPTRRAGVRIAASPAAALRHVLASGDSTVDPRGLRIRGARFRDELDLAYIAFPHPLHLLSCALGAPIDLRGAALKELSFASSHTQEVQLDGAEITGAMLAEGWNADGEVRAMRVRIGVQLDLSKAKLRNRDGDALSLDGAEITGDVYAEGLDAYGAVRASGARIVGDLYLREAKLRTAKAPSLDGAQVTRNVIAGGYALSLDGAEITGNVFAGGLQAEGEVGAVGLRIGGALDVRKAELRNRDGDALGLDRAEITGGVFAEGLDAYGAVRAPVIRIGGELNLGKAKLRRAKAPSLDGAQVTRDVIAGGYALSLRGAQMPGNVFAQGLEAYGEVRALGARIGGDLDLSEAKLRNGDGNALNLESASIKRLILRLRRVDLDGRVRLYRAAITDLETDAGPPAPLVATGWEVTDIHGPLRSDWAAARRWLETTTETSAQPWHALAAVYERNGEPAGARSLRFAAANKVTRQSPLRTRLLRSVYGVVVGHGYHPLWAGFWLAIVILAAGILVAANRADFVPNHDAANSAAIAYLQQTHNPPPAQTPLKPFHYALSTLLPTAVGNATSDWTVRADATWLSPVLTLLKLTTWVLTVLLLAGVTGLLRKA
jgi:uncharacterized protein YjbI with pentapeptide repeats